ncbi:hypothetical protein DSL72_000645 [Monilinia vaccinii-corymbosi]|uniref:F-box domain-containing protein n=1 Tax=Monilinia vaccinii-corymbosi TaxID=61207 RepID=A0A8A3P4P0_9HELO|nr:hypothetical protein DSL72_000645 [Monilinia vaccinii-corymbosi]
MSTPASQTEQALLLPEILAHILLHLDVKTLLLSQRVSKSWATLIQTYPPLQESLFFKGAAQDTGLTLNPLLAEKFPAWFEIKSTPYFHGEAFMALEWSRSVQAENAYRRSDASWRKMFVCQPAPEGMLIQQRRSDDYGHYGWDEMVRRDEGVRMGLVYDYIYREVYTSRYYSTYGVKFHNGFNFAWREESSAEDSSRGDSAGGSSAREQDLEKNPKNSRWTGMIKVVISKSVYAHDDVCGICDEYVDKFLTTFQSEAFERVESKKVK